MPRKHRPFSFSYSWSGEWASGGPWLLNRPLFPFLGTVNRNTDHPVAFPPPFNVFFPFLSPPAKVFFSPPKRKKARQTWQKPKARLVAAPVAGMGGVVVGMGGCGSVGGGGLCVGAGRPQKRFFCDCVLQRIETRPYNVVVKPLLNQCVQNFSHCSLQNSFLWKNRRILQFCGTMFFLENRRHGQKN